MTVPEWFEPMAATLTQERFTGAEWTFERKYDGIRLLAFKDARGVRLYSRNHLPQDLPAIASAIARLARDELVLDGELSWDRTELHVFDLLWCDGVDLRAKSLESRRIELGKLPLLPPLTRSLVIDEPEPWERARREGWEGVIAKRRDSSYEHRRSRNWLKMKIEASQELVIGGFTDPRGKRVGLGALLVGYYDGGDFVFAGKVGTGLDTQQLLALRSQLAPLELPASPFTRATGLPRSKVRWVKPEIVVQVGFMEWTTHGKLRHPRLIGIRTDKLARDVTRDR